MELIIKSI